MVITTKIKELQHFAQFNEIFVLSLCILFTNLVAKGIFKAIAELKKKHDLAENSGGILLKRPAVAGIVTAVLIAAAGMTVYSQGTGPKVEEKLIIYSNADDEAVQAIKTALDENGYKGKYIFQTFGTSELGGKLLAEGRDIEADVVTMSSFYLDSAQSQNKMFKEITFEAPTLKETPEYYKPLTSQEGSIIVNTQALAEEGLPMPESLKDLADPVYEGEISVIDIKSSSTAWLMIQALISEYGEDEAGEILKAIYKNAGPHIEDSGSGPLKKVRSGEVAIGFGLRHQAVADKEAGLPVDYVDPVEGNFSLTESVAVINKKEETNPEAMNLAECIVKNARKDIQQTYPNPLYTGETSDETQQSAYPKVFGEPLTAELLQKHQDFSESCK